jgi:hypothetical protein
MKWIMVLWLLKALGQIAMVAEQHGSSPWHWAFYSSSSLCCTRLRFESTIPDSPSHHDTGHRLQGSFCGAIHGGGSVPRKLNRHHVIISA